MPPDHDGKIRMDCSSPYAMAGLLALKDRYDLAIGNDPDADRHGIVTPRGLMNPNHYLAAALHHLFTTRAWPGAKAGKTAVTSALLDRVAGELGREVYETPVGFKYLVEGLLQGWLGFGGEESAGASFLRQDGRPFSTDKDGILLGLLAAEIMARRGQAPDELYETLAQRLGRPHYARKDLPVTPEAKARLSELTLEAVGQEVAGEPILRVLTRTPGNEEPLGGPEGGHGKRLVRREAQRHRRHRQGLRRKLQGGGAPKGRPGGRHGPGGAPSGLSASQAQRAQASPFPRSKRSRPSRQTLPRTRRGLGIPRTSAMTPSRGSSRKRWRRFPSKAPRTSRQTPSSLAVPLVLVDPSPDLRPQGQAEGEVGKAGGGGGVAGLGQGQGRARLLWLRKKG
jgi:hypothetical protein